MKRKELQALCKEHGIPANLTNAEMVNKLSSLLKVIANPYFLKNYLIFGFKICFSFGLLCEILKVIGNFYFLFNWFLGFKSFFGLICELF